MTLQFKVPSMVCEGCVDTVTKAIKTQDSEATVKISLDDKQVNVETSLSKESVTKAITAAGHTVED